MSAELDSSAPVLSVVLPCLNEERTLAACISSVRATLDESGIAPWEIIVADNGSTDGSVESARKLGAQVVHIGEPGYGRTLSAGILAARAPYVIFADADGTYPLHLIPALYRKTADAGAQLGLASRLRGTIAVGAMPWLHRRVGTPFFTALINLVHGGRGTDCGSGFRCVQRQWFLAHPHHATGMEFASENLIRAYKSKADVVEIPGGLGHSPAVRRPHLRTWRDGMRHLMFILAERPGIFEKSGLTLCAGASLLQAAASWHGPWQLGVFDILGLHTQLLALMAAVSGSQLYFMGILLFERAGGRPTHLSRMLLGLPEDRLFFSLVASWALGIGVALLLAAAWWERHFSGLSAERGLLGAVHLIVLIGSFSLGLFGVHMTRTWKAHSRTNPAFSPPDETGL